MKQQWPQRRITATRSFYSCYCSRAYCEQYRKQRNATECFVLIFETIKNGSTTIPARVLHAEKRGKL